ncbi:MAG: DUF3857 domain-containing protein [Dokdonia sp.]
MKVYPILLLILGSCMLHAQDFEVGKLTKKDMAVTMATTEATPAIYLKKERETFFDIEDDLNGWLIVTKIHKVVKILNEAGKSYGTETLRLSKNATQEIEVDHIKAYVYTLENGKLEKTKIRKDAILTTEVSDELTEVAIVAQAVGVGSVIEFYYEVTSPFMHIDDMIIQDDIPTQSYYAKIGIPEFFTFNRYVKGYGNISPNQFFQDRKVTYSSEDKNPMGGRTQRTDLLTMSFSQVSSEFSFKDIRALQEEPHVNEMNNYRFSVVHELAHIRSFSGEDQKFSRTWEEVVAQINRSDRFGIRLKRIGFLDDDATRFRESELNPKQRAQKIFAFVQNKFGWNGKKRIFTEQTLRQAYKENTGNSAEINLTLVALLQKAGLQAYPILASTKDNGVPLYPTIEGFNYVLAGVVIDDAYVLMDATSKHTVPGILPIHLLNWEGRVVKADGTSRSIVLFPKTHAKAQSLIKANINEDLTVTGNLGIRYTMNKALEYRKNEARKTPADQQRNIARQYELEQVSNLKVRTAKDKKMVSKQYEFTCENCTEKVDDRLVFSPLLFLQIKKSPFNAQFRDLPIDYVFPYVDSQSLNIAIPDGYVIDYLPEPASYGLPDNIGTYSFSISEQNGSLSVVTNFQMNRTLVPPKMYEEIKAFYELVVAKEADKVILKKV